MTKCAVQLDLSLDYMPRSAAVAQKGESGGNVAKTSVKSENFSDYICNHGSLRRQ